MDRVVEGYETTGPTIDTPFVEISPFLRAWHVFWRAEKPIKVEADGSPRPPRVSLRTVAIQLQKPAGVTVHWPEDKGSTGTAAVSCLSMCRHPYRSTAGGRFAEETQTQILEKVKSRNRRSGALSRGPPGMQLGVRKYRHPLSGGSVLSYAQRGGHGSFWIPLTRISRKRRGILKGDDGSTVSITPSQ